MEKLNALSILVILISSILAILSFYQIVITIINRKIMIKSISESINQDDKSMLILFCVILFMLGMGFIFVPAVIIFFSFT